MDAPSRAVHLLQRATFGHRTGDIERVESIGIEGWLDEQIGVELGAGAELKHRLETCSPATRISVEELVTGFPPLLYEGRDLAATTDFRDVFGEVAESHLGVNDPADVFPG